MEHLDITADDSSLELALASLQGLASTGRHVRGRHRGALGADGCAGDALPGWSLLNSKQRLVQQFRPIKC